MSSALARLESRFTWVNGLRMHARVSMDPVDADAAPVVLVPGLVVASRYMEPTAERLGAYFPVYAPDLPGFGLSDKPRRALDLSELAGALADWMEAMKIGPAALLANSFGCQIAVELAVRRPELVSHLILQGPTTDRHARTYPRQLLRWFIDGLQEPGNMLPIMLRDYRAAGLRRSLSTLRTAMRDAVEDKLPCVQAPALVVTGERDPLTPPAWGEEVARRIPCGTHAVVPGGFHTIVFNAAAELVRLVRPFLLDQPVPARGSKASPGPNFVAAFDSATAMVRATSLALHGEDFPSLGLENPLVPLVPLVNRLPVPLRELVYSISGRAEGVRASRLGTLDAEDVARWVASQYPERRYPAVFLGSSGGAAVHLAVAMGVPWLPQTFLIPVKHTGDVDDMAAQMEWARGPGAALLQANPHLALHHMHDPNQDQLMARFMSYFRVKHQRLGETYERFLEERLSPGGTIYVLECQQRWPCTRVDERHVFQPGAVGGIEPWEYLRGSARVEEFLRRRGAKRRRWQPPPPDAELPEAEWGFDPALGADVARVARRLGCRVVRVCYDEPADLSPLVADLYRAWYAELGRPTGRLLVESFALIEPWWALRTASIPFWTVFPVEPAAAALEAYLDRTAPFDDIHAMLFSHGVESAGLAHLARWRALLSRARRKSALLGVEEEAFPRDFAVFTRYNDALKREIEERYPMPRPLSVERLEALVAEAGARYAVRWLELDARTALERGAQLA
ncbi:alpha/beta fold hydrolase [Sorangium sp. So ce1128]